MALWCALRHIVLCILLPPLPAAGGTSIRSFLQHRNDPAIPTGAQVITVAEHQAMQAGVPVSGGVVQPVGTAGSASPFGSGWSASGSGSSSGGWGLQAVVEMMSTAPNFVDEYTASVEGFALTLADRLHFALGVPLSRFAFYIPDPKIALQTDFCSCSNNQAATNAVTARFAAASNSTFSCAKTPQTWKLNQTVLQPGSGALLQIENSVRWEVGVYPPSFIQGDSLTGDEVALEIVEFSSGPAEPERHLFKNGTWEYKDGPATKFLGFFPNTFASFPGRPFPPPRETSVNLGPIPGGHGFIPTTLPPEMAEEGKKYEAERKDAAQNQYTESILNEANLINTEVYNSVEDMYDSVTKGAKAHNAWLNIMPYAIPPDLAA